MVNAEQYCGRTGKNSLPTRAIFARMDLRIIAALLAFALVFFWPQIFITIPSGHVGVLYRRFGGGTVTDRVFGEGAKIIAPWDTLFIYEVRVQETKTIADLRADPHAGGCAGHRRAGRRDRARHRTTGGPGRQSGHLRSKARREDCGRAALRRLRTGTRPEIAVTPIGVISTDPEYCSSARRPGSFAQ